MNYETVKAFGGEKLEIQRYNGVVNDLEKQANVV
jgi:ABC-type transport system involved in Fe-S cluster assembly fused permease/ATPase subunit